MDTLRKLKFLLLPMIAGLLLAASFPNVNQGYLAWIAVVPLLISITRAATGSQSFVSGLCTGVIQFFLLLIWIPEVLINYGGLAAWLAWLAYVLLSGALALFVALGSLMTFWAYRVRSWGIWIFPFIWIVCEYVRGRYFFEGFPWLLVGYSQTDYLCLIQVASATGVYGVGLLVLLTNTAIAWAILRGLRLRFVAPVAVCCALIVSCLAYGHSVMAAWQHGDARFRAGLLQGNISSGDPDKLATWKFREGYIEQGQQAVAAKVDLAVLPESPSPLSFQYDTGYREALRRLARQFSWGIVLNNIDYEEIQGAGRYFNSAYFVDHNGEVLQKYDKTHLVPFGEYVPLKKLFFFAQTITKEVGEFQPGTAYSVVNLSGHPLSAPICFEAVFPDLVRRFVREGSQLIVNLTNDGWYGNTAAPYQHFAMTRWRAIENRRYLLRAANSGISAVIDPAGRIVSSTRLFERTVCIGNFDLVSHQTLYTRYGDFVVLVCVMITAGLGICLYRPGDKPAKPIHWRK